MGGYHLTGPTKTFRSIHSGSGRPCRCLGYIGTITQEQEDEIIRLGELSTEVYNNIIAGKGHGTISMKFYMLDKNRKHKNPFM